MASSELERTLEAQSAPGPDRVFSGVVVTAADVSGSHSYAKAFGHPSLASTEAFSVDTVFPFYSCTKIMTTVAVLQCVEKGLLSLDSPEDVERYTPELKKHRFVKLDEAGKPVYENLAVSPTLRQLMSHQSGLDFDYNSPLLQEWRQKVQGNPDPLAWIPLGVSDDSWNVPFVAEPGTTWAYSPSHEWVGLIVERATQSASLGEYFQQHIFDPLGMKESTFDLASRPDLAARIAPRVYRTENGLVDLPNEAWVLASPKHHLGGMGVFTTASDYIKFLLALLRNDGTLASPQSIDLLFTSALSGAPEQAAKASIAGPYRVVFMPSMPADANVTFGIGGMVFPEGVQGRFGGTTVSWGGMTNLVWYADRGTGRAGVFATNLVPNGDPGSQDAKGLFFRYGLDGF